MKATKAMFRSNDIFQLQMGCKGIAISQLKRLLLFLKCVPKFISQVNI